MSLSNNAAVNAEMVAFVNAWNSTIVSNDIANMVSEGNNAGALRAIFRLADFDFSDLGNCSPVLDVLRFASASDIVDIFGDGQTFKCGTLSLNDVLKGFGTTVWGNLRTSEGAVVELEGGGYIAVSGDCWDRVDAFEEGPQGEGFYSVESDGTMNRDGWFFAA